MLVEQEIVSRKQSTEACPRKTLPLRPGPCPGLIKILTRHIVGIPWYSNKSGEEATPKSSNSKPRFTVGRAQNHVPRPLLTV